MKTALVLGGSGFIGTALTAKLQSEGVWVRGIDVHSPVFGIPNANQFFEFDLRSPLPPWLGMAPGTDKAGLVPFDEVYQLAADVGGAGYLNGGHDADVMANNVVINRNVARALSAHCGVLVFASSSAVYPRDERPPFTEGMAGGAPDSDYGAEKLFSERMYRAHARDRGLNLRIARFANVYGPGEELEGPRTHMVGDFCRKALTESVIEVWGDGRQVRSMVYIDDAVDGLLTLARSDVAEPLNISSHHHDAVPVIVVAKTIGEFSHKRVLYGAEGCTGARSNALDISEAQYGLRWQPRTSLRDGLKQTYDWAAQQISARAA